MAPTITLVDFIKVKGCLDVRPSCEELSHITDLVADVRVVNKTVSALKFRISETLQHSSGSSYSTIQVSGYSATINSFLALSASCPCLFVCSKSFRVKCEP